MIAREQAKIILPIVVLLIAVGVYYGLVNSAPERNKPELKEKVWQVDVIEAKKQSLSPSITLYGRVESPEQLRAAAPGSGFIEKVLVRNGIRVSKGQQLIIMDERDFQTALIQAEADLHDIDNQIKELQVRHQSNLSALETERMLLELSKDEVDRLVKLKQQNLSADTALNNARSTLGKQQLELTSRELDVDSHAAQLQILQARRASNKAKFDEASLAMQRADIRAPFDGIVSEVPVSAGDRVSLGQIMVSLYPINSLEIRAHLPASYIASIQHAYSTGQTLMAAVQGGSDLVELSLVRVAGEAEASGIDIFFQTSSILEQLRPGELLPLNFKLPPVADVIAVPYQAIYGNSRIYTVAEDRLQAIDVTAIGQFKNENDKVFLLIKSDKIDAGSQIATTHLPNAVSGLKVRIGSNAAKQ